MKKTMKKLVALALSLMIVCGVAAGPGFEGIALVLSAGAADAATGFTPVAKEEANIALDEIGNQISGEGWALYKDGELVIDGNVELIDGAAPWSEYVTEIKQVSIVGDEVTEIADGLFAGIDFYNDVIFIPATVTSLTKDAFDQNDKGRITGITDIYFGGTSEQWAAIETGIEIVVVHYHADHSIPEEAVNDRKEPCKEGYTGDFYCTVCGTLAVMGSVTGADHNWGEELTALEGDQYLDCGEQKHAYGKVCADCGEVDEDSLVWQDEEIPHDFEVIEKSEQECGTQGAAYRGKCLKCGVEYGNLPLPAEHEYGEEQTEEATCTEDGRVYKVCKYCPHEEEVSVIEKTGHNYQPEVVKPTCTEPGVERSVCVNEGCGDVEFEKVIPVHTVLSDDSTATYYHTEYVTVVAMTCSNDGFNQLFCTDCEEKEPLYAPALDEDGNLILDENGKPVINKDGEPVVDDEGNQVMVGAPIVDADGEPITQIVYSDPNAHVIEEDLKEPTCTEPGYKVNKCAVCGEEIGLKEILPATGHDWELTTPASCTEGGGTAVFTCNNCGETREVEVEASETHTIETETVPPTCTDVGYSYQYCTVEGCGFESGHFDEVAANGHKFTKHEKIDPTCEEDGEEYDYCEVCGDIDEDSVEVLPAIKHANATTYTTPATCTESGEEYWYCPDCGESKTTYLPVIDHIYEETVTDPTCTEGGYSEYECSMCHIKYTTNPTDPIGHDWDYENAECAWAGNDYVATLTCKNDSAHKDEVKAKVETSNIVPATCKKEGSADYTAVFEERQLQSFNITTPVTRNTPKLAHTPGEAQDIITKNATCSEKGTYVTKVCCTVCGETITTSDEKEIAINPVNHTDRNSDSICDDCGALIGVTLNVPVDTSVRYGTIVTVKANSYAMPNGYKIQAITSSKAYETNANDKEIIVPLDALEETQTIIFRVVDRNGNIAKDSTGSDMVKTVKITVVSNIFLRLIALIRKWLKRVPTVVIEPK